MTKKTIYHYDRATGFFLGAGEADADPLQEGSFLIPAFATEIAPPEIGANARAVFDMQTETWGLQELPPAGELVPLSQLTIEERIVRLKVAVQAHLNAQAQAMGYDSIFTAVTYADEPVVPKFQVEGQALRAWRSLVWAACYQLLGDFTVSHAPGNGPEVPTIQDVLAALPQFELPQEQA